MAKKISNTRATPKSISANNLSTTARTSSQAQKLKHSFAPAHLGVNFFASIVPGLESQVLRIHDTASGLLTSEHSIHGGEVSCIQWGRYYGSSSSARPQKKRKTTTGATDEQQGDVVVAVGLANEPRIDLYSPQKGKVVASLSDAHGQGIRDFCFARDDRTAWSLGEDGNIAEWNLEDGSNSETTMLPSPLSSSKVLQEVAGRLITADTSIYSFEPSAPAKHTTFAGFANKVHSIRAETAGAQISAVLGASEDDSNVVVFNHKDGKIRGNLLATNPIESIATPEDDSRSPVILAAVTKEGLVEVFDAPFTFQKAEGSMSKKERAQGSIKRRRACVEIVRPDGRTKVPVAGVSFEGTDIIVAWLEGGVNPAFHRLPWREASGQIALHGDVQITKSKSQTVLANAKINGVNNIKAQVDDTHTVISRGDQGESMEIDGSEVIDISSAEEESSDDSDAEVLQSAPMTNGVHSNFEDDNASDVDAEDMADGDDLSNDEDNEGADSDFAEPSFGDMLRANAPNPVDVAAAFPLKAQTALVPQGEKSLSLPSGMSLGTVLAQSLRTNDRELLETCFHVQDLKIVRATIERLDGTLAGTLLDKLSGRLHNRPGRAGSLMVWIQWTLVAHGGYLAGQPKVVKQLRQLHAVVKERAQALSPLLLLKGKLDMLEAQMRLRKNMVERSRVMQAAREEEEEDAIYVEGQEDEDSSDEEGAPRLEAGEGADPEDIDFDSDEEAGEEMGIPTQMEVDEEDEDEDEDEEDDDLLGGLIDGEAEETEDDSGMDEDVDHDDVDTADETESEIELEKPTPKAKGRPKVNGVAKRR